MLGAFFQFCGALLSGYAMSLNSKILFSTKALVYGVKQETLDAIIAQGWSSMGAFAFSCSCTPASQEAGAGNAFINEVVKKILGSDEASWNQGELAALRRLYFEAWLTTSQDMKHRLERRDDDPPRKLPDVERQERKANLASKWGAGLKMEHDNEPSDALIDLAVEICESGVVRRLVWELCTSRTAEVENEKWLKR